MNTSLLTSVIACCFVVISTIGTTTSAGEQKVLQTNRGVHVSKAQPAFPLVQKKIEKVEGKVRFYKFADNDFLVNYPVDVEQDVKDWMVKHYDRMQVYAPWFDEYTEWYTNGLEYKDLYAIYDCAQKAVQDSCEGQNLEHQAMYDLAMQAEADPDIPDWILKDSDGNPLYIPYNCNEESGKCPQFAADLRNPAFRKFWIKQMSMVFEGGDYRGLFVDDVNLDFSRAVSDGNGCRIIDNGCDWTVDIDANEWADLVAAFVEEIRSAFPNKEIAHNSVWFHADPGDPYLERQVDAADTITLERGINDPNMTSGDGVLGIESFLDFSDYIHSRGRNTVHTVYVNDLPCPTPPCLAPSPLQTTLIQMEYGLAGWLLASGGHDWFATRVLNTPDDWWHGFDTNLGKALGERYVDPDNGLLRRDFKHGIVLLNVPDADPVFMNLPETFYTLNGDPIDQVTLVSRTGKILFRNPQEIDSFVTP